MLSSPEISVVIPVYNSQNTLKKLAFKLHKNLIEITSDYEVIFIDDGSSDDSWSVLQELKKNNDEHFSIIRLAKNFGQHNATFCGFAHAKGQYIVTIDDDLQYHPEDIKLLYQKIKTSQMDLIYGIGKQQQSFFKKTFSKFHRMYAKHLENALGKGSSFRILSANLKDKVICHEQYFIFIDEILFWYTDFIGFTKVTHHRRPEGKSGYDIFKTYNLVINNAYRNSTWALRFMIWFGGMAAFISFFTGLFFIFKKLILGIAVPGFTAIMVSILFSSSIILWSIGVLGNYLISINIVLNKKPMFAIKKIIE